MPSIVLEALPREFRSSQPKSVAVPQIPSLPHPRRSLAPERGVRNRHAHQSGSITSRPATPHPPVTKDGGRNNAEPCGAVELSSFLPFSAFGLLCNYFPGAHGSRGDYLRAQGASHSEVQGPDMAPSARLPFLQQTTNQNNPRSGSAPTAAPHPGRTPCTSMFLSFVSHPTPGTPDGAVRSTKGP